MLRALHVQDFIIVRQATLEFLPGFTALTGETGAGKSILIDALSLALGGRGDSSLIRETADNADISAIFDIPEAARPWLAEQAMEGDELILRRVLDRQGRSKAYINGRPVILGQLRELAAYLLDIHGQHVHHSLLQSAKQRDLLDAHGGHHELLNAVNLAWSQWQEAVLALDVARQQASEQAQTIERLMLDCAFLDDVNPAPGEWPELCARQARLSHAQALLQNAAQIISALDGEEASVSVALQSCAHALQNMLRHDPALENLQTSLDTVQMLCREIVSDLNSYADQLEMDPDALARADRRMGQLFEAGRRFHVDPQELPTLHENLRERLQRAHERQDIASLEKTCQAAETHYLQEAGRLSEARRRTAETLSVEVTRAMQELAMQGGSFKVALKEHKPAAYGLETVEFLVAGHAGTEPRPLARVASGGELARISLALSVIASQASRVPCLIFDEVDSGIGGAVAEVVGRLLQNLGQRHQVLCVTHLPQVAARAAHHFAVRKQSAQGDTHALARPLDTEERIEEIARMLGGLEITGTSRQHAREMLQTAKS